MEGGLCVLAFLWGAYTAQAFYLRIENLENYEVVQLSHSKLNSFGRFPQGLLYDPCEDDQN